MNLDELLRTAAHDVASHAMPDPPDLDAIRHRARRTRVIRSRASPPAPRQWSLSPGSPCRATIRAPPIRSPTPRRPHRNRKPAIDGASVRTGVPFGAQLLHTRRAATPHRWRLPHAADHPGSITAVGFVAPGTDWIHFGSWTNKGSDLRSTAEVLITDLESLPRDACDTTQGWREVSNPMAVATALADLEQMTVLQAPSQGQMLGYPAVHLRLQGPQRSELSSCNDGRLAFGAPSMRSSAAGHAHSGHIHDLWLVELDSAIVAVEQTWFPETPEATVQELRELVDSLYLEQE